jgi:tetratricopeptide (TPR) repeat protein
MNAVPPMETLLGHRYQRLEELGRGGMGVVYKVHDRLTGETVALKQVSVPATDLQFSKLTSSSDNTLALALEFRALASLRHPNIVSVLDYGFQDRDTPFYTMQYLERASSITEHSQTLNTSQKIGLITQVLSALVYLHRHHILHRDLKPQNIFVTADGIVKVMDFGLAVDHREISSVSSSVGTLAYMAPELFAEESASIQSDLYAVGIIAYEMFVGTHPFKTNDISQMLNDIFLKTPDVSMLDSGLASVIKKLLAKIPMDRYAEAAGAIAAFDAVVDLPIRRENSVIRESFLQASSFVGRESEMGLLKTALENVLGGQGGAYLIGGESGVGKSRLMEELRIRALMQGSLVMRGQEVAENGLPYQLWREPLRRLILNTDLTSLEASILKEIMPDIGVVLNREVADAPPLSGRANRLRLNRLIVRLFKQQKQPMVLLLEDLQWMGDSKDLLNELLPLVAQQPWLIVATYRDDEAPHLPSQLSSMQSIKLGRLPAAAVAELSEAMLGHLGTEPQVLDLIQRESEGNTFFIVEVVRALAEDAGSLESIGLRTLPERIFSGGIQKIVAGRLGHLPEIMRDWLKWAAVQGREVDLKVCQLLVDEATIEGAPSLDKWLTTCLEAAVFEVHDEKWRFSHDKLREAVLHDLSDEEKRTRHRQVATAIEQIYPRQNDRAASLYEHWSIAGDILKQAAYAVTVNNRLERSSDYRSVIALSERVVKLLEDYTDKEALSYKLRLLTTMGVAYDRQNNADIAKGHLQAGLALAVQIEDIHGEARALSLLGNMEGDRGNHDQALTYLDRAQALAESIHDIAVVNSCLSNRGIMAYMRSEFAQAQAYWEEGIRRLDGLNERYLEGGLLINLGSVAQIQGNLDLARDYWEKSRTFMREVGERNGYSMSLQGLGNLARGQGDYVAAMAYYEEGITVYREIGNRSGVADMLHNLGIVRMLQHDHSQARPYLEQSLSLRREIDNKYGIGGSLIELGHLAFEEKNYEEARRLYNEAQHIFEEMDEPTSLLSARNGLAQLQLALQPDDPTIGETFRLSLKGAQEISNSLLLVESVLGLAEFLIRTDALKAAELTGWVSSYTDVAVEYKTRRIGEIRPKLEGVLSADVLQEALQRGRALTKDQAVEVALTRNA